MKIFLRSFLFRYFDFGLFWYVSRGCGLGVVLLSYLVSRIFGVSRFCPYLVNYASRVQGNGFSVKGDPESVKLSLAVSAGCFFAAGNGIEVGEGTIWSHNVVMTTGGHDFKDFSVDDTPWPIKIGKKCWIGANVTILPGVVLGDSTIVGANSVVTKSFPEGGVVVAGVPAKVIKNLKP